MLKKYFRARFYFSIIILGLFFSLFLINSSRFTVSKLEFRTSDSYTINTIPGPGLISPTNNTYTNESSVILSWEYNINCGFYIYQVNDKIDFSGTDWVYGSTSDNTQTTLSVTLPDGKYFWRIRGFDKTGQLTYWSPTWSFTIDHVAPLPPSILFPSNSSITGDNTTTLAWQADPDEVIYQLQLDDISSFTSPILDLETTENYTCPEMADGVKYWRVRSTDLTGNVGNWSDIGNFRIYTYLGTSTLISLPNETFTKQNCPEFEWTSVENATSYILQIDDNMDFTSPLIQQTILTNYECAPLLDGVYFWRVQAQDDYLNVGAWSEVWYFEIYTFVGTPTLISPINQTLTNNTTPELEWSNVENATSYILHLDDNAEFTSPFIHQTALTNYEVSSLTNGIYYWRIQAQDDCLNLGAWSGVWNFEVDTIPPNPPILVLPLNNSVIADVAPYLDWSEIIDAIQYRIQIDITPNFSTSSTYTYTTNSFHTITSNLQEETYYWRVSCKDATGNWGIWSDIGAFIVDATSPSITAIEANPKLPMDTESITISANITDTNGVESVLLYYRINGGTWINVTMDLVSGDFYSRNIGILSYGDFLEYFITANDTSVTSNTATNDNSGSYYSLTVSSGDLTGPIIWRIEHTPMIPYADDNISITCSVTDANGIQSVMLYFRVDDNEWFSREMVFLSGSTYEVNIGLFNVGEKIDYYIVATDNSPNANLATNDNSTQFYSFTIAEFTEKSSIGVLMPAIIIFGLLVYLRKKQ